jgi:hypothetical protein
MMTSDDAWPDFEWFHPGPPKHLHAVGAISSCYNAFERILYDLYFHHLDKKKLPRKFTEFQFFALNEQDRMAAIRNVFILFEPRKRVVRLIENLVTYFNWAWTARNSILHGEVSLYERRVRQSALFIHWEHLHEEQDFLIDTLEVEPSGKAKINMARRAIETHLMAQVRNGYFPQGYGLLELIAVAERFMRRDIGLEGFEYVKDLSTEDWWLVYAYLQQLYYRYEWLWWHHPAAKLRNGDLDGVERRKDLLGHLLGPFGRHHGWDEWNACVIGLDRASPDDALLAVNFALFRIWRSAQYRWRVALEEHSDDRVPTFVVLDEAHNFAPLEARNDLQKRVTDKLVQIAAEGRKYGVYLILATQRPRKLHPSVVLECENVSLLRVQSQLEQDFAEKEFAIPNDLARRIGRYVKGQALLSGRWVEGHHTEANIAPARAVVGGGGVPDLWMVPPSLEPRMPSHAVEATEIAAAVDEDEEIAAVISGSSSARDPASSGPAN